MSLQEYRKVLYKSGDGFAIEMIDAMERRATARHDYADALDDWIESSGTVKLRELCKPFVDFSFLKTLGPLYPMPWFNCVDAIDNASLKIKEGQTE